MVELLLKRKREAAAAAADPLPQVRSLKDIRELRLTPRNERSSASNGASVSAGTLSSKCFNYLKSTYNRRCLNRRHRVTVRVSDWWTRDERRVSLRGAVALWLRPLETRTHFPRRVAHTARHLSSGSS